MLSKVRRILRSERGEANYISTLVYIFITVIMLAFILNVFAIITAKQQMDHLTDQMTKQIQLSGGLNSDTDELFDFLSSQIGGVSGLTYTVDSSYKSPRPSGMRSAIQLGTPFYITVTGKCKLGGFWNLDIAKITMVSRGAGVSEIYWK